MGEKHEIYFNIFHCTSHCSHNIHQHQSPHVLHFQPAPQLFTLVQRAFYRHYITKCPYKSLKIRLKLVLFARIV